MRIPPFAPTRACVFCFLFLLLASVSFADEVHLKNNDRYTGKVVTLEKGTLKFDTGHGLVDLPWAEVTALRIDEPVIVTITGRPERTFVLATAPDGRVTVEAGTVVALTDIVGIRRPNPPFKVVGGANLGLLSTSGNTDVNSLHADGEVVAQMHDNRYTASAAVNHGSNDGVENVRNTTVTGRYDRFLTRRVYANASAIFTNDRFRDLDLRTALAVGIGVQVADNSRAKLSLEAGYGYVKENFSTQADISYNAARETVSLDVYLAGKRIVLFHRHDGFFGISNSDNLFVQTRNGVRLGMFGNLVTTLEYDVDYDRSPAPGRKQTDTATGVTFGYRF